MDFIKYQHIERLDSDEVEGIDIGQCYIFPKIDGSNGVVWLDDIDDKIKTGTRNRECNIDNDNQGFSKYIRDNIQKYNAYFAKHPQDRLYGEWLVKHSLKTYRDEAWCKFYIFDVAVKGRYLKYEDYIISLEQFNIDYIPCIAKIENPKVDDFYRILQQNNYLIKDGEGIGEGIVIKNYDYRNKYGRQTWAKIVTSEFKEKHIRAMGTPDVKSREAIEEKIINEILTDEMIRKTYFKIKEIGWDSKKIPQLLGTVYHDFIIEESWNIIKKYKNPVIDFKLLQNLITHKIKIVMSELF